MVHQNIAETPLNISSIVTNFKSFMRQLYKKHRTQNNNKRKDQNNYFRAQISQKEEQLLPVKVKKAIDF